MPKTFQCPSCSAPLGFEGTPYQKCEFCGRSVIVPSGTFSKPGASNFGGFDLSSLTGKALKIAEIQRELNRGNKINAVKIFRETFGVDLAEAKKAIDAMERGDGIDVSGMRLNASSIKYSPEQFEYLGKVAKKTAKSGIIFAIVIIAFTILLPIAILAFVFFLNSSEESLPFGLSNSVAEEVTKFGGEGTGAGKFKDNRAVAVDKDHVYSINYEGERMQVFTSNGKFVGDWKVADKGYVIGLAANREGTLYLGNTNGIFAYDGITGKLLNQHKVNRLQGLAISPDDEIVASIENGLSIFDRKLRKVREIKDAATQANSNFGFSEIAVAGNGTIYAIEKQNKEICKFSVDGKFLNRFSSERKFSSGFQLAIAEISMSAT